MFRKSEYHEYTCLSCFESMSIGMYFLDWWVKKDGLCHQCRSQMMPKWIQYEKQGIKIESVYPYDGLGRDLLLNFKDSHDRWLKDVFLNPIFLKFHLKFWDYTIVVAPGSKRPYQPNVKLLNDIYLPVVDDVFEKIRPYKQSERKGYERHGVYDVIALKNIASIQHKKVLLFDDLCTSGHTLRACYELIVKEVSQIKVFTLFYHEL